MESNDELKENDNKNRPCNYFGYIIKIEDFDFDRFYWMKDHTKIFWFMIYL